MKQYAIFSIWFLIVLDCYAQNPIVPPGVYMADPSAHVWADGKLYVYGSRDESPEHYCSWRHDILVTDNLKDWVLVQNAFSSKGPGDQVTYSDDLLFAPDCQYKNGLYYLYYCLNKSPEVEGVATSVSPVGPFLNGKNIQLFGHNQIDPCVFMDDDGQAYYIWGQFQAKVAKMKPDMMGIDSSTIHENVVTEKDHYFHEGGYMVKRKGIYYFIYAHMGRAGMPTCIGYSTAGSPFGPFKYGGVIIDNNHSDPANWNNHGSLVEFRNQWYVFYHRATHNSYTMRKTCVEPITFNTDGSINEVEMTTQGAAGPLPATSKLDAARACLLYGNVYIKAFTYDHEELTGIKNDDKVCYKYLDFGNGTDSFTVVVAPGSKPGKIDIALDHIWSPSVGQVDIPGDGDGKTWHTYSVKLDRRPTGVHALLLRFSGEGYSVDWFQFR